MNYDKTYHSYKCYADKCKSMIKDALYTVNDALKLDYVTEEGISDLIKMHRLKMINIKIEHTMRMIEQIVKINDILGFKIDLALVTKIAILYHDVGRLSQATWCNTYSDTIYKTLNRPYINHGEEGYDIFLNNDFNVDSQFVPIIGQTILHHQNFYAEPRLSYRYENDLNNININDIATGKYELNDAEWQVASLIVQLVADIDKTDILYQHLSDDFNMIRNYVTDNSRDTLDNISNKWGISKKEIIEFNNIDEDSYEPHLIKIPIANMEVEKLELPNYFKEMFYNNSWPELKILVQDKNWNFISILWWRLSHFLNSITFNSILINIEECRLLEQIYEKVPNKYKPLVKEAFEYAEDVLVSGKIKENKGKIYLRNNRYR